MSPTLQSDLFGEPGEPGEPAPQANALQALVRIVAPAAKLTKAQREFNRLTARIRQLREELALWRAARERAGMRQMAEVPPLQDKLRARQREFVLWIDAFLSRPQRASERLSKKLRQKLGWMLQHVALGILVNGADEEIEAVHDRHSPQRFRDEAEGEDSLDDEQFAEDPAEEDARAAHPDPAPHAERPFRRAHGTGKAQARDLQRQKEATQSVREVYRRLASSLHPDREPDAVERARKTVLMAKVNEAYERGDLLELLSLQMAIEQIDEQHLRDLPEQRLRQYIQVLKDQEYTLRAGIESEREPLQRYTVESGRPFPSRVSPTAYDGMVEEQLRELRALTRQLGEDFALLADERTRRSFLTGLDIGDPNGVPDDEDEDLMEELLAALMAATSPPGRPRGRRR